MRFKWSWRVLVCFFLLLPIEVSAATMVLVTADILNVRTAPWGELVGRVYQGRQFLLEEVTDGWGRVEYQVGRHGWISLDYTCGYAPAVPTVSTATFCEELNAEFDRLGWPEIRCRADDWKIAGASGLGRPLFYNEYGSGTTVTILICSVHSDESTVYQGFRLRDLVAEAPHLLTNRLVIVPLLNPDGFLQHPQTRTNGHGVDLNRNLPTSDWQQLAIAAWKQRYGSDARRNPGPAANSEPENRVLLDLLARYAPDKVLSIHSPLNFLDLDYLDGPVSDVNRTQVGKNAMDLAQSISKDSHFRFRNYNTFPGSLGRFGSEWRIPIYTLELPGADPSSAPGFFDRFKQSLVYSFNVILDDGKTAMNKATPSLNKKN